MWTTTTRESNPFFLSHIFCRLFGLQLKHFVLGCLPLFSFVHLLIFLPPAESASKRPNHCNPFYSMWAEAVHQSSPHFFEAATKFATFSHHLMTLCFPVSTDSLLSNLMISHPKKTLQHWQRRRCLHELKRKLWFVYQTFNSFLPVRNILWIICKGWR